MRRHRGAAAPQNRGGTRIVPVVDDTFQNVGVSHRHGVEEVAGDHLAAIRDTRRLKLALRVVHATWQIEYDAFERGNGGKDPRHQRAVAAANIDDFAEAREVASRDHRAGRLVRHIRHRAVEDGSLRRVSGEIVETFDSVKARRRGFAGLDAAEQVAPDPPHPFASRHQREIAQGPGHVRAQCVPHFGQRKVTRRGLFQHA